MGIRNLIKYIQKYNTKNFLQCESGNNIYVSNIVYIDLGMKLADIYDSFIGQLQSVEHSTFEDIVDQLITFATKSIEEYVSKYAKHATRVYVFVDRKTYGNISLSDILFKDFIYNNIDKYDKLKGAVMIKRKYVDLINSNDIDDAMFAKILRSVRNLYELTNIYSMATKNRLCKYINVAYVMRKTECEKLKNIYRRIYDEGINRYIMIRKAKYLTKHRRITDKMLKRIGSRSLNSNVNAIITESTSCEQAIDNYNTRVPFSVLIYMFPNIVANINIHNVQFFGCDIESDYAIVNHINAYSKNAFPTIITSDSDMAVMLCNVNCIIKLVSRRSPSIQINPTEVWLKIFGCVMNERIIKITCVLLGSDYNPYYSSSPIHIANIDELKQFAAVKSFESITEEMLLTRIYLIMNDHPNDICSQQTGIALNMYLRRFEYSIRQISGNENVNIKRFIKLSKMDCLFA